MTPEEMAELYDLLSAYGSAKFGDEWWPGSAAVWIGPERAARLDELTDRLIPTWRWHQAEREPGLP